jgi:hypothetical protein
MLTLEELERVPEEPTRFESYEVHSEARGPHWTAWITRGSSVKPERGVVVVGETQEEAESHARQWYESYVVNHT